jgi:25S rRNA (uracil2634-N3)-methyltransferase
MTKLKRALASFHADRPKRARVQKPVKKVDDQPKRIQAAQQPKFPYSLRDRILLLGEANFSFALSVAKNLFEQSLDDPAHFGMDDFKLNMIATTLDSRDVTFTKYTDAEKNIAELEKLGCRVLFDIDATKLDQPKTVRALQPKVAVLTFDKIVFNFPHVGLGIKDQARNIAANQILLSGFLQSAMHWMNNNSEIHVTLKSGPPYENWGLKKLARQWYFLKLSTRFVPLLYPGYAHRRTLGFQEGLSVDDNKELDGKEPRMYIFQLKQQDSSNSRTIRKKKQSHSSDEDE